MSRARVSETAALPALGLGPLSHGVDVGRGSPGDARTGSLCVGGAEKSDRVAPSLGHFRFAGVTSGFTERTALQAQSPVRLCRHKASPAAEGSGSAGSRAPPEASGLAGRWPCSRTRREGGRGEQATHPMFSGPLLRARLRRTQPCPRERDPRSGPLPVPGGS